MTPILTPIWCDAMQLPCWARFRVTDSSAIRPVSLIVVTLGVLFSVVASRPRIQLLGAGAGGIGRTALGALRTRLTQF